MKKTFSQIFRWDEHIVTKPISPKKLSVKIPDTFDSSIKVPAVKKKSEILDTSKILKEDPFFFQT